MKKKLLVALPVLLLLIAGAAYKLVLAPSPVPGERRIDGTLVALTPEFVVNLEGGHYAKFAIAVVLAEGGGGHGGSGAPVLDQNAAVRAAITDELTGRARAELIDRAARRRVLKHVLHTIEKTTDEHVTDVLLTDLTIQ